MTNGRDLLLAHTKLEELDFLQASTDMMGEASVLQISEIARVNPARLEELIAACKQEHSIFALTSV